MPAQIISSSDTDLQIACELLQNGFVTGLPTETVYGLGANACDDNAVAKIYEFKSRPKFNPLIIHCSSIEHAQEYACFNDLAYQLAHNFWPGSLTMVLPKKPSCQISMLASAGLDTVAIRIPNHQIFLHILRQTKLAIAAPSANPSEYISPTCAQDVMNGFATLQEKLLIVDGGPCTIGLESTIIDVSSNTPQLLRPGIITKDELQNCINTTIKDKQCHNITAPGQMLRHYAPSIPMRLNATHINDTEAFLTFGSYKIRHNGMTLNLSVSGNLREAAANLFHFMRQLDNKKYSAIAVAPIPHKGIGVAINDRLVRAAH